MDKVKYWYLLEIEECPVCGAYSEVRIRQYTEKPLDAGDRIKYSQVYDYCMEME